MSMQAPYPATVRAKGWRFELDHERIEASATWALAPAELRPWLLMLWMTSWKQTPCGSLDSDDAVIAARIGMPARMWAKHRAVLMRGWVKADDGRLYHATVTELVIEMMERRRSESDRKAAQRARHAPESHGSPTDVPRDNTVTPAESDTDHRPPNTNKDREHPPTPRKRGREAVHAFPPGFEAFWAAYPRKVAKDHAAKAYARLKPDEPLQRRILAALAAQVASEQWTRDGGRFVPHAATWLNGRRWEDEAAVPDLLTPAPMQRKSDRLMAWNIAAAREFLAATGD